MNDKDKKKHKWNNVTSFSFTTFNGDLMMVFTGFDNEDDLPEFADYVFSKIKMKYFNKDTLHTIH
tara:strand:- start:136 stop:330 length:195 start_codon:yes stop_codon:yes gene_type:complete